LLLCTANGNLASHLATRPLWRRDRNAGSRMASIGIAMHSTIPTNTAKYRATSYILNNCFVNAKLLHQFLLDSLILVNRAAGRSQREYTARLD
jgi:hypothetical protein